MGPMHPPGAASPLTGSSSSWCPHLLPQKRPEGAWRMRWLARVASTSPWAWPACPSGGAAPTAPPSVTPHGPKNLHAPGVDGRRWKDLGLNRSEGARLAHPAGLNASWGRGQDVLPPLVRLARTNFCLLDSPRHFTCYFWSHSDWQALVMPSVSQIEDLGHKPSAVQVGPCSRSSAHPSGCMA